MEGLSRTGSSLSIADRVPKINEKWPKNAAFCPFAQATGQTRSGL